MRHLYTALGLVLLYLIKVTYILLIITASQQVFQVGLQELILVIDYSVLMPQLILILT